MTTPRDEMAAKYGTSVMSSMFTPTIDDYWRGTVQMGMPYDITWLSASVRTKSGKRYVLFRAYQKNSSSKFYMQEVAENGMPSPVARPHYLGYVWYERPEGEDRILVKSYEEEQHFSIDIEPSKYRWREGDDIDLSYEALGPSMRWYSFPGEIKEEILYTVEPCKVTGTINGEEVAGFGSMDQVWQTAGLTWHQSKLYLCVEDVWVPFMNQYDDGSYEYGHFITGRGDFKVGYFVKDGVAHMDPNFTLDIDWDDKGNPKTMTAHIDGHELQWSADVIMRPPESTRAHITYAEGHVVDLNETRKVVDHQSWMEYRPFDMWGEVAPRIR